MTAKTKQPSGRFYAPRNDWETELEDNHSGCNGSESIYPQISTTRLTQERNARNPSNESPFKNSGRSSPTTSVILSFETDRKRKACQEMTRSVAYLQLCDRLRNASLESEETLSQSKKFSPSVFWNLAAKEKQISSTIENTILQYQNEYLRDMAEADKRLKLYRTKLAEKSTHLEKDRVSNPIEGFKENKPELMVNKDLNDNTNSIFAKKENTTTTTTTITTTTTTITTTNTTTSTTTKTINTTGSSNNIPLFSKRENTNSFLFEKENTNPIFVKKENMNTEGIGIGTFLGNNKKQEAVMEEKKQEVAEKEKPKQKRNGNQDNTFLKKAEELAQYLKQIEIKNATLNASSDPTIKKQRLEVKKVVGEACNQISSQPSSIRLVTNKLDQMISNAKQIGNDYFDYVLDFVALKLVGRSKCITESSGCFPVAHVIKKLCLQHIELPNAILAHFHKICMYTIPKFRSKSKDETTLEYKTALGYEKDPDAPSTSDGMESYHKYVERMTLIVALLGAIMQTPTYDASAHPPGLGIQDAWSWLARIVNLPPNIFTASILIGFLEVAAFELLRTYKRQFKKILSVIEVEICPRLPRDPVVGSAATAARLDVFIQRYKQAHCSLNEPEGRQFKETQVTEEAEDRAEGEVMGYQTGGRGRGRGGGGGRGSGGRGRGGGRSRDYRY